tara:strand:+ start:322 stop:546 length:225 start_codon:yes stop_codon:yes gene_type:complete
MPIARSFCPLYADLYKKCVEGKNIGNMKICDDYVFMLKSMGCAYHYYEILKLDTKYKPVEKKYKTVDKKYHSER